MPNKNASDDNKWMRRCLRLAWNGVGHTSPNPLVGAVLVKQKRVIGSGWHRRLGGPHAEMECLEKSREDPSGATLYVNLEPCSHIGKTPPCADSILRAGITRVVIGMKDPNPLVAGRGIRRLQRNGVHVRVGVLEGDCRNLNRHFIHHIVARIPYVHVKIAQTIDGRITGPSKWISGSESRALVHLWRGQHDAILVGSGTILKDDPLLNVRLARGRDPDIVLLDGLLSVPVDARVFRHRKQRRIFLCCSQEAVAEKMRKVKKLGELGVAFLSFPASGGRISLRRVCRRLYRERISSLLVEGGADLFSGFLRSKLINELSIFISPQVVGRGLSPFARTLGRIHRNAIPRTWSVSLHQIGKDVLLNLGSYQI